MNGADADALDARDMARLVEGQDSALNALMDRHAERLYHYLARSLQDESDAADLAQETFAKVYQHRARYDSRQRFSTWLYAIASNLVRNLYRWRKRHPRVSLNAGQEEMETEFGERFAADARTPSETLERSERAEAVRKAVAALPQELRAPLLLAEYEAKSQAEIAQILGCTAKAVETRIYRARKQLRSALADLLGQIERPSTGCRQAAGM